MSKPIVGSLVFATNQGLGVLAKSFYDAGIVDDVLVIRHGKRKENDHWYPGCKRIGSLTTQAHEIIDFCRSVDVMLFFETPFLWGLFYDCRMMGVKTILMPMYECMPSELPSKPHLFLNPSPLDQRYYPQGKYLPVPFQGQWKERGKVQTFVHNAGNGGLKGRNGTREFVKALEYLDQECDVLIRSQTEYPNHTDIPLTKATVSIHRGDCHYESLYDQGEVFVFPEKFNGLSLPIQEAYASGMLVCATDRFPNTEYLDRQFLIPSRSSTKTRISGRLNEFDEAVVHPRDIADTMNSLIGVDISEQSRKQKENVCLMYSWEILKPQYLKVIKELVEG